MNKCILIGYLASDPESRTTQSGIAQCSFRLAVQRAEEIGNFPAAGRACIHAEARLLLDNHERFYNMEGRKA